MYESFYNLKKKPFSIVSDPSFLFMSAKHKNALTYLEYGLMENAGFILLTGAAGSGKTTMVRYILNHLAADMEIAVVFNTNVNPLELLNLILQAFQLGKNHNNKSEAIETLYNHLTNQYAKKRKVLLIIDEAQNLTEEALEEMRMLSNLQSENELLLHIMLVGQPELKAKLRKPGTTPLSQRIAVNFTLTALSRRETLQYIQFRLEKAGGQPDLFSTEAMDMLYSTSAGIPRTVNLLCDAALVYGFGYDLKTIDKKVIEQVLKDKDGLGVIGETRDAGSAVEQTAAGDPVDSQVLIRLERVENSVRDLQIKMEWYADEAMFRSSGTRMVQLEKLKRMILSERKKRELAEMENKKLVRQLGGLESALKDDIKDLEEIVQKKNIKKELALWLKRVDKP